MKNYIKNYPRPQFIRNKWENLNGDWNFTFDDENLGEEEEYYISFPTRNKINVPFTYETNPCFVALPFSINPSRKNWVYDSCPA